MSDSTAVIVRDSTVTPLGTVPVGPQGDDGADGVGVPAGGTPLQVLGKATAADFDTGWVDQTGGGSGVVETIGAGTNIDVDASDPANPVVSLETLVDADIPASIARDAEVADAVEAHRGDTTNVHGIADTAGVVLTGDSRLSDARTPTAHATSHQDGGSDELALDGSQITSGTIAVARIHDDITRDSEVPNYATTVLMSTGSEARPAAAPGPVLWVGTMEPTNWIDGDSWLDTDAPASGASVQGIEVPVGDWLTVPYVTEANTAMVVNELVAVPLFPTEVMSFDRLIIRCQTAAAGSSVDLALWDSDAAGVPRTLLGQVNVDTTTTGEKLGTVAIADRPKGVLWASVRALVLAPSITSISAAYPDFPRRQSLSSGFPRSVRVAAFGAGALPATFPAHTIHYGGNAPVISARRSG